MRVGGEEARTSLSLRTRVTLSPTPSLSPTQPDGALPLHTASRPDCSPHTTHYTVSPPFAPLCSLQFALTYVEREAHGWVQQ